MNNFRITNREKSRTQITGEEITRRLLEEREAKRWTTAKVGDLDELHSEFLHKLRVIRESFASDKDVDETTHGTEDAIRSADPMCVQKPVDINRLLDLI